MLCIGGAMANTFLHARGEQLGNSLLEADMAEQARRIVVSAAEHKCELLLPVDAVIAGGADQPPRARPLIFADEAVPPRWQVLDVGPATVQLFSKAVADCDTIVWNGPPPDCSSAKPSAAGTLAMAEAIASLEATHDHLRRRDRRSGHPPSHCAQDEPHQHRRRRRARVSAGHRAARHSRPARIRPLNRESPL